VRSPRVFSLFSGIGGSSLGYKMAGFDVLGAVEFLDYQAANYRANWPGARLYEADIRELDPAAVLSDLGLKAGELDVLDGSPPCSPFSVSGSREGGWGKVKKFGNRTQRSDDLFGEYVRFLRAMRPRAFVAENVPGLAAGVARGYLKEVAAELSACGYRVAARIVHARLYGVPQDRRRLIIVGIREDLGRDPEFPTGGGRPVPLAEALAGVPNTAADLAEVEISRFAIHAHLRRMRPGRKSGKYLNLVKARPDRPCPTVTATAASLGAASVCHWDDRKFTVPELRRICSFPDGWKAVGKGYRERAEGFGRAVPPLMMRAVASAVAATISKP
jgi:DNA (cytosine-5)-methyltransferase 1